MKNPWKSRDFRSFGEDEAEAHISEIRSPYHRHRLAVISALFPSFLAAGASIRGVEPSRKMIEAARAFLSGNGLDADLAILGDVNAIKGLPDGSVNVLLDFNVLAYLGSKGANQWDMRISG